MCAGIVFTEPLWGIPYNLYAPFVSVYMLALGLSDSQIGLLASIGLIPRYSGRFSAGALTDKFGRKRTTYIGDLVSWAFLPDLGGRSGLQLLSGGSHDQQHVAHHPQLVVLPVGGRHGGPAS